MRDRSEDQMTLVLIRHGETRSNREHRYLGRTDEALSKEGERQLREYKKLQRYPAPDFLFVSPMKRCIQSAEILYPGLQPVLVEEWKEMDFGAFEGKNYAELQKEEGYQRWLESNGTLPFPEGESREAFILRCDEGFRKMLERVKQIKKEGHTTIGMVVHGGTIMALLSKYGEGDYFDYQAANAGGYLCTLQSTDRGLKLVEPEKI